MNKVEHPQHYNREGGMECLDEMLLLFGQNEVMSFCKLNAWKYRYRAADKNGEEDLKKSDWYLQKYKELSMEHIKIKDNAIKMLSNSNGFYHNYKEENVVNSDNPYQE